MGLDSFVQNLKLHRLSAVGSRGAKIRPDFCAFGLFHHFCSFMLTLILIIEEF